ncbi:hypothetical protein HYPSUDRAFT_976444 [Hypholoma sublateritium FD-334 SS-4]|uniref:Uncharacterized protein n=1 Tax=Hypholoma sublateritium (strain FD-334 SS-4) TaxID=945553 RepID=A0A0D2KTG7_HYPSF|nr:hypothetical protein HYPSUDRAFT_976444 [Hypholoma sublateritium FD-334 SS-4]
MIMIMSPYEKSSIKDDTDNIKIEERQLGVWTLRTEVPSNVFQDPRKLWIEFEKAVPFCLRLLVDIYNVAPYHLIIYLVCKLAEGLEEILILGFSDKLLRAIEIGLVERKPNVSTVVTSILSQLACSFFFVLLKWYSNTCHGILRAKVSSYFQLKLMKSNLHLDLAASQEAASRSEISAGEAYRSLERIVDLITDVLRSGGQLAFIAHASRSTGGPWFVIISLAHPILSTYLAPSLWDKVCFGYVGNPTYQRIQSLEKFADGTLRQDIISGGLAGWIISEYRSGHRNLGNLNTEHPSQQLYNGRPLVTRMLLEATEFAPMTHRSSVRSMLL